MPDYASDMALFDVGYAPPQPPMHALAPLRTYDVTVALTKQKQMFQLDEFGRVRSLKKVPSRVSEAMKATSKPPPFDLDRTDDHLDPRRRRHLSSSEIHSNRNDDDDLVASFHRSDMFPRLPRAISEPLEDIYRRRGVHELLQDTVYMNR